jgi:hypothetical protein
MPGTANDLPAMQSLTRTGLALCRAPRPAQGTRERCGAEVVPSGCNPDAQELWRKVLAGGA